jgi:hypothetical protein
MAIYRGVGGAGDATVDASSASTLATTKAAEAATSAANAAISATAAATSATTAEGYVDTFDDKYLGSKSSAPTVDNDGDALTDGALYFNTTSNIMFVYDLGTTAWLQLTLTSTNQTNVNTVATNISNVNSVAGNNTNITAVAGNSTNINTVAGDATEIGTVAGSIANVNTVATNVTSVNSFALTYLGAQSSAPTTSNVGALYYNTTTNNLFVWSGSAWDEAAFSVTGAVTAFNSRTGAVTLSNADVTTALSTGGIATAKIADSAITTAKIADSAITTAKIADDAVTADKLANSINTEIAANTAKTGITSSQASAITANTAKVTNATHTGDVTGATALTIANDAVTVAKLNLISTASVPSLEAKGTSTVTDGYIQLNCSENSHGIKLKSPPHSAGASYTLTFPNDDGNASEFLQTDGSGVMTWAVPTNTTYTAGAGLSLGGTTFTLDLTNAQTFTGVQTFTNITETQTTKSASFTPNLSTEGTVFSCTGTMTITMPTAAAGKSFTIVHATGNSITWAGTIKWNGGSAPTAAAAIEIYVFYSAGTNWYGMQSGTGFA